MLREGESEPRRNLGPLWAGGVVLCLLLLAVIAPLIHPVEVRLGDTEIRVLGTLTYSEELPGSLILTGVGPEPLALWDWLPAPQGFWYSHQFDPIDLYSLRLGSCAYRLLRRDRLR